MYGVDFDVPGVWHMLGRVMHLALTAIGRDRPGIVAATTAVLLRHGINVEDSRMSILRGHFTMMLIVSMPDEVDRERLRTELEAVAVELGLEALALSEVEEVDTPAQATHVVTVYGVDHPGIVHRVAAVLAERRASITDLQTRLVDEGGEPSLYALLMEVALPARVDASELDAALASTAESESVDVSFHQLERHEL